MTLKVAALFVLVKQNNCYPDKNGISNREPILNCRSTMVERRIYDTTPYDGVQNRVKSYFIFDECPLGKADIFSRHKCFNGTSTNLEEHVWVSCEKDGKIFQNQNCAKCNGMTETIPWLIRIACGKTMLTNMSTIEATVLSESCAIITEPPDYT